MSGARLIRDIAAEHPDTDWTFEYSPESFSATEPDFALEICEAVLAVWQPTPEQGHSQPAGDGGNGGDQMSMPIRSSGFAVISVGASPVLISVHPHNDRGAAVAAAELALLAGADRVEGTLFGNGERTGNVDIVTLALNLFAGIDLAWICLTSMLWCVAPSIATRFRCIRVIPTPVNWCSLPFWFAPGRDQERIGRQRRAELVGCAVLAD